MMRETQRKIVDDIEEHKTVLLKKVEAAKELMADEVRRIKMFESNVEKEIIRVIELEKKKEFLRNGGSGQNDILATDAGRNLKKQLLMKADRLDIEKLFEIKSNVSDT
jgi:hypothetical protein